MNNITILCKVIDNYGDIGVAYRLLRSLKDAKKKGAKIGDLTLVVDDLASFFLLCPKIDTTKSFQIVDEVRIFSWDLTQNVQINEFLAQELEIIIECFACGRPDWLENILFDEKKVLKAPYTILNLEYLTAEQYAEDFHLQKALTRSKNVQKYFFMPGFTSKTGGLILDDSFMESKNKSKKQNSSDFNILLFNYQRDFSSLIKGLNNFQKQNKNLTVLLARGKSFEPFLNQYKKSDQNFSVKNLDFLPQEEWDFMLCNTQFMFIRGEDSLSRAILSGVPFVWHAYPQTEEYQLVKVKALLSFMHEFFEENDFSLIQQYWLLYNGESIQQKEEDLLLQIFVRYKTIKKSFESMAQKLEKNGNLADNLMTFIGEIR